MPATAVSIRLATPADAPALLAIYAPYVENTAITFEYETPALEEFRARIARTLKRYPYVVAEVAEDAGARHTLDGNEEAPEEGISENAAFSAQVKAATGRHAAPHGADAGQCAATSGAASRIVGYAYASPFKGRPAYDWAVETSIYVDGSYRRGGVGRALHNALQACLAAQGILNMEACIAMPPDDVDEPHLTCDSARFHEHMGYRLVGRFMQCGYKYHRWYDMIWMEKLIGEHAADAAPIRPFPDLTPEELAACGVRG